MTILRPPFKLLASCTFVQRALFMLALLGIPLIVYCAKPEQLVHATVGQTFVPTDVDWQHPIYDTHFDDASALADWRLEGGKRASTAHGKLVLASDGTTQHSITIADHVVYWLAKEMPADFLLEFSVRPQNRTQGLNIIFFNTRGIDGNGIFAPPAQPRNGLFNQYTKGGLDNYHVSYWSGQRGTANIRKNKGFHLVATGKDLVYTAPQNSFQIIRLYKRAGTIRLMVDDEVSVAYDDDGKAFGPVWNHAGYIGLRQMAHTVQAEYDYLKVYPLK